MIRIKTSKSATPRHPADFVRVIEFLAICSWLLKRRKENDRNEGETRETKREASILWPGFCPSDRADRYNASEPNYYRGMQMRLQSRYRVYPDSYIHIHVYVRDKITVRQLELRGRRAASGAVTGKDLVHENMPRPRIPSLVHLWDSSGNIPECVILLTNIVGPRWLTWICKKERNMCALLKLGSKFDISVTTATQSIWISLYLLWYLHTNYLDPFSIPISIISSQEKNDSAILIEPVAKNVTSSILRLVSLNNVLRYA